MAHLREEVAFEGYAQKQPLIVYKERAYERFAELMSDIDYKVIKMLLSVDSIVPVAQPTIDESTLQMSQPAEILMPPGMMQEVIEAESNNPIVMSSGRDNTGVRVTRIAPATPTSTKTEYAGVGRNDLCPCGSGKKFKHCHGR